MPDEKVEGAKIAANILNRMPADKKQKLLEAIRAKSAGACAEIERNILDYEDIVKITDRGVQLLIKELDPKDLVLSLKLASPEVKARLLKNMSKTKAKIVMEDFEALGRVPRAEAEAAQQRVVRKIDELRTAGSIITAEDEEPMV